MDGAVEHIVSHAVNLKVQGKADSQIIDALQTEGLSKSDAAVLVSGLNEYIDGERRKAMRQAGLQKLFLALACIAAGALALWGLVAVMSYPGNFTPFSVLGLDLIGTVLATGLGTIALTAFATFLNILVSGH